jgi:putative transposase
MQDDLPRRKRLPHDVPPWVAEGAVFFVSVNCIEKGQNLLCTPSVAEVIAESFRFYHDRGNWFAHLLMVMPDHVHALMSFPREQSMRSVLSKWKEFVAKKTGVRWQRDFFDHRLRTDEDYTEKAHYIRMNPVRKRLVTRPEDWVYVWEFNKR